VDNVEKEEVSVCVVDTIIDAVPSWAILRKYWRRPTSMEAVSFLEFVEQWEERKVPMNTAGGTTVVEKMGSSRCT
jgi:hypothetical protein